MQVKKQQLELNMEQQIGSKLGKEYVKVVCCHPIIYEPRGRMTEARAPRARALQREKPPK